LLQNRNAALNLCLLFKLEAGFHIILATSCICAYHFHFRSEHVL